eukprot:scaffold2917_cov191-Amphora_coffeaeformis.AAC.13
MQHQSVDTLWRSLCALHWRSVDKAANIIDNVLKWSLTAQQCFAILIAREPPCAASEENNDDVPNRNFSPENQLGRGSLMPRQEDDSSNDVIFAKVYTLGLCALDSNMATKCQQRQRGAGIVPVFELNIVESEDIHYDHTTFLVRSEDFADIREVPLFREAWPEGVCLLHLLEGMNGWIPRGVVASSSCRLSQQYPTIPSKADTGDVKRPLAHLDHHHIRVVSHVCVVHLHHNEASCVVVDHHLVHQVPRFLVSRRKTARAVGVVPTRAKVPARGRLQRSL